MKVIIPLTLAFIILAMIVSGNDAGSAVEIGLMK